MHGLERMLRCTLPTNPEYKFLPLFMRTLFSYPSFMNLPLNPNEMVESFGDADAWQYMLHSTYMWL